MKTSIVGKYATVALFSLSFIALNNCGSRSDSANDHSYNTDENGTASDLVFLGAPPAGYPVIPGAVLPTEAIETNCNDGTDDEGDGLVDCQDTDCQNRPECAEYGPPLEDLINSRSTTVYPNGIMAKEDVVFLKARGGREDHHLGWLRNNFFATNVKDCWINPKVQDPYYHIPHGEALVAGPDGPIGPQLSTTSVPHYGPRAGLIEECEYGTNIFEWHYDDDNGDGAGAGGDDARDEEGNDTEND